MCNPFCIDNTELERSFVEAKITFPDSDKVTIYHTKRLVTLHTSLFSKTCQKLTDDRYRYEMLLKASVSLLP